MANFTSLANYIATITARFNKPRRNLINEGILKTDIIDALSDAGKWAEDVRLESQALNTSFIARSLNLGATIYVDGVNGLDTRTGTTNNGNAITGPVKTLARVAELHSGKTAILDIVFVGNLDIAGDVTIVSPYVRLGIRTGVTVTWKKVLIAGQGEGTARLILQSSVVGILHEGAIVVEGHAGKTGSGGWAYGLAHGAISILNFVNTRSTVEMPSLSVFQLGGSITVGTNAILFNAGGEGINTRALPLAKYSRDYYSGAFTLAAGAVESTFTGDRTYLRIYHPTSSTDTNVSEGETVISSVNNKLWTKRGGQVRDAMGTLFA